FPVAPGAAVIGRAPGNDIVLPDRAVSRQHARLELAPNGHATICDLGSHNGTWVDGRPAVEPTPVGEGVLVQVGSLEVEVRPQIDGDRPPALDPLRHTTAAGTIPFNRPPRPAPAPPAGEVTAP